MVNIDVDDDNGHEVIVLEHVLWCMMLLAVSQSASQPSLFMFTFGYKLQLPTWLLGSAAQEYWASRSSVPRHWASLSWSTDPPFNYYPEQSVFQQIFNQWKILTSFRQSIETNKIFGFQFNKHANWILFGTPFTIRSIQNMLNTGSSWQSTALYSTLLL